MRLQKYMASCGVASRRASEEIIAQGRVTINDTVVLEPGTQVEPGDVVCVDGVPIEPEGNKRIILLYKPVGVMCTLSDPEGRPTVADLVDVPERVYPVGRLDFDTQGALLLTNDGELARALTHPSMGVEKAYIARVKQLPTPDVLQRLRRGIYLSGEPRPTAPCRLDVVRSGPLYCDIRMVLHEGRNRQVRRMLEAVGHPVLTLRRESVAGLTLEGLQPGEWRDLTREEAQRLRQACNREPRKPRYAATRVERRAGEAQAASERSAQMEAATRQTRDAWRAQDERDAQNAATGPREEAGRDPRDALDARDAFDASSPRKDADTKDDTGAQNP